MEYLAEIHAVCWIEIPNQRDSQQAAKSLLCLPTDKGWVTGVLDSGGAPGSNWPQPEVAQAIIPRLMIPQNRLA